MDMKKIALALVLFLTPLLAAIADELPSPMPGRRVNDFASLLDKETTTKLESLLTLCDEATTAEIAIVTVNSLGNMSVEDYSLRLFNAWGIGKKNVNNGILLLLARSERKARLEVGLGLEQLLDNERCKRLLEDTMVPFLRNNEYSRGVLEGLKGILRVLLSDVDAAEEKYTGTITQNTKIFTDYLDERSTIGTLGKDSYCEIMEIRGEWVRVLVRGWVKEDSIK